MGTEQKPSAVATERELLQECRIHIGRQIGNANGSYLMRRIDACLSAAAEPQPVAWLIEVPETFTLGVHRTVHLHNAVADYGEGAKSTPLYAAPCR